VVQKKAKCILVIFPRGESIANFVGDNFIEGLKKNFEEVHFLSIETERLTTYASNIDKVDSVHLLKKFERNYFSKYVSSFLDLAHNLKIRTVSSQDRIRFRKAQTSTRHERFKLSLNIGAAKLFANESGLRLLEKLNQWTNESFNKYSEIEDILDKINPDLVFNTSHVHNEISHPYIYKLKKRGVRVVSFIFSWDNITSQGRIMPKYDHLMTWNNESKNLIDKYYGVDYSDKLSITGTPQFDHYFKEYYQPDLSREEFCNLYSLDPNRPIVLYSTGMPHHMPGEPIIVKRIVEVFDRDFKEENRPQLILRVYPKDNTNRFEPLRSLENLVFQDPKWDMQLLLPSAEAKYILKQTILNVDLGINIASTITLELLMFEKKVLNIGFTPQYRKMDDVEQMISEKEKLIYTPKQLMMVSFKDNAKWYSYDHYIDVTKSECCVICMDETRLRDDVLKSFDYQYNEVNRQRLLEKKFSNTLDGGSINRITKLLSNLHH
jgi:hypothetical protein